MNETHPSFSDGGFATVAGEAYEPSEFNGDATQNDLPQENLLVQDVPEDFSKVTGCGCHRAPNRLAASACDLCFCCGAAATLIEQTRALSWQGEGDYQGRFGERASIGKHRSIDQHGEAFRKTDLKWF